MNIKKRPLRLHHSIPGPAVAVLTTPKCVQMDADGVGVLIDQRLCAQRARGRHLVLFIRDALRQTTAIYQAKITTIRQARGTRFRRHVYFRDARRLHRPPESWRQFAGSRSCEIRYAP